MIQPWHDHRDVHDQIASPKNSLSLKRDNWYFWMSWQPLLNCSTTSQMYFLLSLLMFFFFGCNQCGPPVYSTCDCLLVMASKVLHLRICTHNEWVNTTETFSFVVNKTETIERRPRCLCKSCVEKTQRIKRYVKCIREKLQVNAAKIYSVNLKYKDSTKIHLLFPEMHYEKSTASMQMVNPNPNNNLWVREWAVRCSASMAHKRSKWTSNNFHSRLRNMTSAWAFTDNNMSF